MDANAIWSSYIRYMGAARSPPEASSRWCAPCPPWSAASGRLPGHGQRRRRQGDPDERGGALTWVIGAAVLGFLLVWLVPVVGGGLVGAYHGRVFSFFFAVVSGRMVGLIGASNNRSPA